MTVHTDFPPAGRTIYKLPCWQWTALLKCPWAIKSLTSPETVSLLAPLKAAENREFLYRYKQGITWLIQHLGVVFLPLARCRGGDCSRKKWWRGGCWNEGWTYRWQMTCCWSQAWGCSSQSHRNTAFLLGCTCIHTYSYNVSINSVTSGDSKILEKLFNSRVNKFID